ncbi:putative protein N(5)-glutamine methyltransferase [Williamsia sterculiae]|uniref:peptide chain release factor N(5)-glutamine methyltransferase n=1 Tax=Williamsia sterculiae TaxID=1344003 RepID=A0A1N7H9U6_9NOCA|nr:putative protein N(5)-glutamine methyltransferase [Williamsia sterculiae]SIS21665.1 release factor glutamine methyltransferase [Williamsia sterculiae]
MTVGGTAYDSTVAALRAAGCVFAEEEARILLDFAHDDTHLTQMLGRRVGGAPLEHIVGSVDFYGLRIHVGDGVFVPRVRTEALVRAALDHVTSSATVLELCCGCAGVAAAIATNSDATVYATDIDDDAVACARRNLAPDRVFSGDLFGGLPDHLLGQCDVVVANAPYVPTREVEFMPPEAREHEPRRSLDGGEDGLDLHRRIAVDAPWWLADDGTVVLETSRKQAATTEKILQHNGFDTTVLRDRTVDGTVVVGTIRPRL